MGEARNVKTQYSTVYSAQVQSLVTQTERTVRIMVLLITWYAGGKQLLMEEDERVLSHSTVGNHGFSQSAAVISGEYSTIFPGTPGNIHSYTIVPPLTPGVLRTLVHCHCTRPCRKDSAWYGDSTPAYVEHMGSTHTQTPHALAQYTEQEYLLALF